MRIINTGRKFSGSVDVCGKQIHIDTSNGIGFHEIFKIMKGPINTLTQCFYNHNQRPEFEDIYQDICVAMLEGIFKYQPNHGAALSTFLYMFARNRIIDMLRVRRETEHLLFKDVPDDNALVVLDRIDIMQRSKVWDYRWKKIISRIFIDGDKLRDVAKDEDMTPWGLTKAIRRELNKARKA